MSSRNESDRPDGKNALSPSLSSLSRRTAFVLDNLIRIPGTQKRVGLDPIIGLIPGVGDFIASAAGIVLLVAGLKSGVSKTVYLRMISNWTLNALIGAIPFAGDLFSFWFKSNHRNQNLIKAHLKSDPDQIAVKRSWWPFFVLLIFVISVFLALGIVIWLLFQWLSG